MTAPALSRHHALGLQALLSPTIPAYLGESPPVTTRPARYVVLWVPPGLPEGTLGDRHRWLLTEFIATAVGGTYEQCLWAADTARTVLLGQVPTVAGRIVHPLWQVRVQPAPPRRDDDLQPPVYVQPVSYGLRSVPA